MPDRSPAKAPSLSTVNEASELPDAAPHRSWRGKRIIDVLGAVTISLSLSPLILVIALSLALTGGSVVFRHSRIGNGGQRFHCYKFRTMVRNSEKVLADLLKSRPEIREEWLLNHKIKNDPRITWIGSWLRRTSLDEIPQLWNVFKGDMSLVGPRPIVSDEVFRYGSAFRHYLSVKPGITGLWQVTGRNDTSYRKRVALDRLYAMRQCPLLDFAILMRTVPAVIVRQGAY